MILTESQLRRYIKRMLSEAYQSYPLKYNSIPSDPRIPSEDVPIIQTIAKNVSGADATVEVTDDQIHISLFTPRGDTEAFLTHHLKDDTWTGSGPSEKETEMFGERKIDHDDLMDFAKNFGFSEGPVDRKMSAVKDFFTL